MSRHLVKTLINPKSAKFVLRNLKKIKVTNTKIYKLLLKDM
jgi:hypothetical protein